MRVNRLRLLRSFLVLVVFLPVMVCGGVIIPSYFQKVVSEIGIDVYKHKEKNVYMQLVDVKTGAQIKIDYNEKNPNKSNEFKLLKSDEIFFEELEKNSLLFSVTNADLFDTKETVETISEGYGVTKLPSIVNG